MLTVRPAIPEDAPAIARVHVASWRETYAGIVPDEFLASLKVERREVQAIDSVADRVREFIVLLLPRGQMPLNIFEPRYRDLIHAALSGDQRIAMALLQPGDTILGMSLAAGGHLTHGASVNQSGKWFKALAYGLRQHLSKQNRPAEGAGRFVYAFAFF